MKQMLIWFNLHIDRTGNGLSNLMSYFCRKFAATNVSSSLKYVYLQGWSLRLKSSSYDGWAKFKKKYLMHQIPIKMLKQHGIPNASLHNVKIIHQKGAEKLVKDELYVSS